MAQDILIVDDESDIRTLTAGILEDEGYKTREAADSQGALEALAARRPSLVLLDIWLQGSDLDGLQILKKIKEDHPDLPVLMMSGHGTVETAVTAIKDGAYDFIEKPFKSDRLLLNVRRAVEAARLRSENEELKLRVGSSLDLIGTSSAIKEIQQIIERAAPSNSRILIHGPSGSGKEIVARNIHARSQRAEAPFVIVNCATMAPERVETELFGTEGEDGSRRIGTFERAHGGTLVLDEVADMPLETQGKIVRVLQEQNFERVGGTNRVQVDVRVISSTTRDLQAEVTAGKFREDLFYRLNVVPLTVPALADRREDIRALTDHFMRQAADATGQQARRLSEDALAALQSYDWPGNVRELRNVIERVLILAPGDNDTMLGASMLPTEFLDGIRRGGISSDEGYLSKQLRDAREDFEREYLSAQMSRFGGNISKTAQFVGMERSALHRKLKSLGLTEEDRGAS
ncbi:MAG: sigma-54 dependent transcriptional regulator [Rhodospirillales bacterium]